MEMIAGTLLSLERCKPCGGTGRLGMNRELVCETCEGKGFTLIPRAALLSSSIFLCAAGDVLAAGT